MTDTPARDHAGDGIHLTAAGHRAVADLVWKQLESVFKTLAGKNDSIRPPQDLQRGSGVDPAAADDADQHGEPGKADKR